MRTRIVAPLAMLLLMLFATDAWAQRQITGRVTQAGTDAGVSGASVTVKGTSLNTFTDDAGNFSIRVPERDVTLVVTIIGYRMREVSVPVGQTTVTIPLETDVLALDELVVTGAATEMSRRILPNAVGTVNDADLDRAPTPSLEKSIQAKVPGAVVEANSGAPGGGYQVRLRGVSTINALSEPLYVVDGVVVSNAAIPSNQNAVTRAASGSNPSLTQDAVVNRIVDINPEDIESVEILKGASAAAIYGSKASNGVVVITTKKGTITAPRINITQRFGYFDLSNTLGFRQFETVGEAHSVFLNPQSTAADTAFITQLYGSGEHHDLEELLAGRNDLSTETSFSVSGGTDVTHYFLSGLVKNDEGIIPNTGFKKQSVRLNLDQQLSNSLTVGMNTNVIHTNASRGLTNNDNSGTSFYMVYPFTPAFVDLRPDEEGVFPANPFERSNPLQTAALMENDEEVWRFLGALHADWVPVRTQQHDLRVAVNGGLDYFAQENELFFPPELQFEPLDDLPGTALLSNSDNLNLNIFANLVHTFRPVAGTWSLTSSAGYQFEDRDLEIARIVQRNLIAGRNQIDAGTSPDLSETRQRVKDEGMYLQEELLMLDDRLLVTAGIRADRSSVNGDPDEFFFYPKAAASYRFVDLGPVEHLKLRAAWGQSGNLPLYGQKFTPLTGNLNIGGLPGLVVTGVTGADDLQPERQSEIEAGFDAELLNRRASLEFTVYQKDISDLLLQRTVSPSTGFFQEIFNGGELRTRGVEAALGAVPVQTGNLQWITRATFFADRSEVTSLPVPSFRTGGFGTALGAFQIEEGESATQIVAVISEGDSSFVAKVGDANPDFKVGFMNEIVFGNFNLYSLFDWQHGQEVINLTRLLFDFGQNTADFDADPQFVENIGPVVINETLTAGQRRLAGFGVETRPYIEDASFLKLRELALGYTVPQSLYRGFLGDIESLRITVTGRDLLTWTDYTGLDPEVSNFGNQPIARNIDVAPFPPSRSFWLAVDVSF